MNKQETIDAANLFAEQLEQSDALNKIDPEWYRSVLDEINSNFPESELACTLSGVFDRQFEPRLEHSTRFDRPYVEFISCLGEENDKAFSLEKFKDMLRSSNKRFDPYHP